MIAASVPETSLASARGASARRATARVPGTCGEWVQGTLDGTPCLISCSIDAFAQATVELGGLPGAWDVPGDAPKARRALALALAARGDPPIGGCVRLANPLPRGRGYASSTADVAGTIVALGAALGQPFSAAEVARLAVQVEPSDSTMFPAPALLAHRDAAWHRQLPQLPALAVVVLDPGGEVDTLAFNRTDHRAALAALASWHRDIFAAFEAAAGAGDAGALALAATQSALAHQKVLPSALVEHAQTLAPRLGALGICRAHSGTLVGLICAPAAATRIAAAAASALPGVSVRAHRCLGTL